MKQQKFLVCKHCGNLVGVLHDAGVPIICCGEKMQELTANTTEASTEKHIPVVTVSGNTVSVKVGAAAHPMTDEHYIEWVYLQTDEGGQRKALAPGKAPEATFAIGTEKPLAVYAYCNLHGLWKADL
ncbi:MAG: desulfoferrodoxin [Lachnospiraceae bacterium]|jgi:superoxide reductase|nr:desulfoferrodoxin [Lachnospiraceae bacterium]